MVRADNFEETKKTEKGLIDQGNNKSFIRKQKGCPICLAGYKEVDYKDQEFLYNFISEGGRMLPSRITNVCAKHQRSLKKSIRHSRILALLPFVYKAK